MLLLHCIRREASRAYRDQQQQRHQHADDRNHHEQFDERKTRLRITTPVSTITAAPQMPRTAALKIAPLAFKDHVSSANGEPLAETAIFMGFREKRSD